MPETNNEFDDFFKEIDAQEQDVLSELEKQELQAANKETKEVYKTFGKFFLLAGAVVFIVAVAEQAFNFQFFSGRVYGISLFMMIIGGLLWRS